MAPNHDCFRVIVILPPNNLTSDEDFSEYVNICRIYTKICLDKQKHDSSCDIVVDSLVDAIRDDEPLISFPWNP